MVRTVSIVEDEDPPDSSSPRESKRGNQKGNALRSKHSETEQRRRSKINERFQILMDLIPENDQKRDKASFLLEVIQYIQFLHEKLQMYEGSVQDWSPEPTKLTPWRFNSGPVEIFIDQSHYDGLLSNHEDNIILNQTLLSNAQNSVESDLTGAALYNPTVNPPMITDQSLAPNMSLQQPMFEDDCSVPIYSTNEEELRSENGEASISSAYSQGLLSSLTNALQSSGVDLSQANLSVQLDVRKRTNDESTAPIFNMKDHKNSSGFNSAAPANVGENYAHPHKRLRGDWS